MDKATQFWNWFKINETKYYSLDQISDLDIGYIDVTSFDSVLDKNTLIELKKLPDYLNWLKSRSKV